MKKLKNGLFPQIFSKKKLPVEYITKYDHPYIRALYFDNPYHTAWRYFSNPNPWIKPTARYAATTHDPLSDTNVVTHADITPQSKHDLCLLWLAASDSSIECIRGFTQDSMKEFFTQAIALIARGHNWDTVDAVTESAAKRKMIEDMILKWDHATDDMGPDEPSCNMGVNQRLIQSVMGNPITDTPESRPLDPGIIRTKYAELLGTKFYDYLNGLLKAQEKPEMDKKAQLEAKLAFMKKLEECFDTKYVMFGELTPEQQKIFDDFRISNDEMRASLKDMKKMFGDRFEWIEMQTDSEHFSSYAHYFVSLNEGDPWQKAAVERLIEQMRSRTQSLENELSKLTPLKEEKQVKDGKMAKDEKKVQEDSIFHEYERKREKEEVPKKLKPESPRSPKRDKG